jgi:tRNA A37 threonylcarbamoyladenosine synthetase subunit TsaC/SUA5/YrdC
MKVIDFDSVFDLNSLVEDIVSGLNYGPVLVPSDGGYVFLIKMTDVDAINYCREITGEKGIIPVLFSNKSEISSFCSLDEVATELIEEYLPGKLILEIDGAGIYEGHYFRVRNIESNLLSEIVNKANDKLLILEANKIDKPPVFSVEQLKDQFSTTELEKVELILDAGTLDMTKLPTIVRVVDNQIEILRQGELVTMLASQFSVKSILD